MQVVTHGTVEAAVLLVDSVLDPERQDVLLEFVFNPLKEIVHDHSTLACRARTDPIGWS